jgi:uncharacterized membrane protein YccC
MAISTQLQAAVANPVFSFSRLFSDLRVQYGIKLGLGGLLSLYVTQALRLEHANWAILSTLVMMNSQYVGAIGIKAAMRIIGTIVGSLLAVWLVGTYSTTPAIFLPGAFLVVAVAGYKFGQFPASQSPYAYFLIGNAFIAVTTYSLTAPDTVWLVGINRTLETLVGVLAALLVNSVVWPRFARRDFFENTRAAVLIMGELMSKQADAYIRHGASTEEIESLKARALQGLGTMRSLFQIGARESANFRSHLGNYTAVINSLSNVYQSTQDLERWVPEELPLVDLVRNEIESFLWAAAEAFVLLAKSDWGEEIKELNRLKQSFSALEERVTEMRRVGTLSTAPVSASISFLGRFAALRQIKDDLVQMREGLGDLPQIGKKPPIKRTWHFTPTIDVIWLRAGIKGGISVLIAFVLMKWINPPGSPGIPLSAWLFSFLGRTYLKIGDAGDRRVFLRIFQLIGLLTIAFVVLTLLMPLLANYAVMNAVLFLLLFIYGFLTARIAGINFWMNVAIIGFSIFVGLNPQVPVASTTIINSLLGLLTGVAIASVIGRLFWPILPQRILKNDLLAFLNALKTVIAGKPMSEKFLSQVVVLPVDARQAASVIVIPDNQNENVAERRRISQFVQSLQTLAAHVRWLIKQREDLPHQAESIVRPHLKSLETEFEQLLDRYSTCMRIGDCRGELPTLASATQKLTDAIQEMRDSGTLRAEPVEVPIRLLQVVNRYLLTSECFERCSERIRVLQIHRYWGDWVL